MGVNLINLISDLCAFEYSLQRSSEERQKKKKHLSAPARLSGRCLVASKRFFAWDISQLQFRIER